MPGIGIGIGIGARKRAGSYLYPSYLETSYTQTAEGEDLVDGLGVGATLPYVSGFGVNQIFDLSPLSDDRWNKNAYIGNAFALPEYYDFPYIPEIYFDTANPYHWKIKDFHYRYYEEQADSLTNIGFAKLTYGEFGYGAMCTTDGLASIVNTVAYGEWEFDFIKTIDNNGPYFQFISDRTNADLRNFIGYQLYFSNLEAILLRSANGSGSGSTLFYTANAYYQIGINYKLKIVRNSVLDEYVTGAIGTFAVYIKGGSFGSTYVLVDTTGGGGSNPATDNTYTTSAYTVLDFDSRDVIRNYSINGILQDFYDFTVSTGAYAIDNLVSSDELLLYQYGEGLECLSIGVVYQASTAAYGVWEFSCYNADDLRVYLIGSTNDITTLNGYWLRITSTTIDLRIITAGNPSVLFLTPPYLVANTYYSLRVVRNSVLDEYVTGAIGTFAVYIKGGSFGSTYVLLDTTGGSGTNPITNNTYTTSANILVDSNSFDKIKTYFINGTQIDTRDFTVNSGSFRIMASSDEDPELSQVKWYVGILPDYYGYNIIINGTFDSDTGWLKGTGWSISGGTANCSGVQAANTKLTSLNAISSRDYNETFLLTYEVIIVSGGIDGRFGFQLPDFNYASGIISKEILSQLNGDFIMEGDPDFTGSIDNVNVQLKLINYYKNEYQ